MGENSRIEWTDHTFNCWIGCAKVSTGCANCYAERDFGIRRGMATWGVNGTRLITSDGNWKQPLRWNRKAAEQPFVCRKCGTPYFCESGGSPRCDWKCEIVPYRPRVFCGSLCDWLEDRPELDAPLARLLLTIHATPNLQWLLLTKRPELFAARMVAALHADEQAGALAVQWAHGSPMPQAAIGASVENQEMAKRIDDLARIPAALRFLSCEPLVGPLVLPYIYVCGRCGKAWTWHEPASRPDPTCIYCDGDHSCRLAFGWVIAGGESGPKARPTHPDWIRSLRDQCQALGVPFFFKQFGEWGPIGDDTPRCGKMAIVDKATGRWTLATSGYEPGCPVDCKLSDAQMVRVGKKAAGRLLDGRTWDEFPKFFSTER